MGWQQNIDEPDRTRAIRSADEMAAPGVKSQARHPSVLYILSEPKPIVRFSIKLMTRGLWVVTKEPYCGMGMPFVLVFVVRCSHVVPVFRRGL